jgi:hypothetical protein
VQERHSSETVVEVSQRREGMEQEGWKGGKRRKVEEEVEGEAAMDLY